jgi:DNA-binding NtrC family response regulator
MAIFSYHISLDAIAAEASARAPDGLPPRRQDELAAILSETIAKASFSPSNPSLQQISLDFARRLKSQPEGDVEECLLLIGPSFAELYIIEGTSEDSRTDARARLAGPYSSLIALSNQEAVTQFFRSALGWLPNGERDPGHVEAFRRTYALASEHGHTGVALNRLFQRALWLHEKARLETDFFRSPIAIEEVLIEVAGKIFGGLKERAALFVGNGEAMPRLIKALRGAGIGRLYFASTAAMPETTNSGQAITSLHETAQLPFIDLLLLFDHADRSVATRAYLQKLMAARHHAPLLLADWTANDAHAGGLEKMYNLFVFHRRDLARMVEQNAPTRRQVEAEIAGWIKDEVQQFYQWLTSEDRFHFGLMVGRSLQMQKVFELIARIAQTDITVLIEGESGTGKELVARAIHESSSRSRRPFIAVNCGALPETLLESELFGHVRGAFTGAVNNKRGLFEEVNGGTIFLDEIGEMSPALQVKLLRFLQDGEIKPVGSNVVLKLEVRVLAATNRHLPTLVNDGKFRSDLFYRLNVIGIRLPPLRERPDDIEMLARHFLRKFSGRMRKPVAALTPETLSVLRRYSWPGNVRELENVMERAVALTGNAMLDIADLPAPLREEASAKNGAARLPLKEIERRYILDTISACNGNYDEAAKTLGIGRTTLWRKLKIYSRANGDFSS